MKKIIISILGLMLLTTSCKKEFLDVNSDPARLTSSEPELILSSAIVNVAYSQGGEMAKYASIFSNQMIGNGRQMEVYSQYVFSASDFDNLWKFSLYGGGSLKVCNDLINISQTKNKPHYQALGKILLALSLVQTSDMWGDIPYSQAFKGNEIINPKFDNQESIYLAADKLLDEGIALLSGSNNGSAISSTTDLLYGGSVTKWKKFAYGIKARNYIHLSKVDKAGYSQKALTALANSFSSASDNAVFAFGTAYNNSNPWFQFNDQRGDLSVHESFISLLDNNTDPRKDLFVDADGYLASFYASTNSGVDLLTFEEIKFIEAEAKLNLGQDATSAFVAAVSANVLRVTGAADASFVSSVTSTVDLEKVMTQKHIALFTNPEAWTDWRRTGFPMLTPNVGSEIPRSFFYPAVEVVSNSNCPANTSIYRKVWWDK
jgi:hypothetical protein